MRIKYYNWLCDEIAREFGGARLDAIVLAHGGTVLAVPRMTTPTLNLTCGPDIAAWLCEQRGGERIYICSRNALDAKCARHARDRAVATSDHSANEIAVGTGLSERQIRRIRARLRAT